MIRVLEPLVFLSLAAGLHVGMWTVSPRQHGTEASGGPGQASVTLAAASAQHEALAKTWTAPPKTAADPVAMDAPQPTQTPPRPRADLPRPALMPAPPLPAVIPVALPQIEPPPLRQAPVPDRSTAPTPAAPDRPEAESLLNARPRAIAPDAKALHRSPPEQPAILRRDNAAIADATPHQPVRPARKPAPPAPSAPAAQAAGGGDTANPSASRAGKDPTQSASAATRNVLQARWGAKIQGKVHRRLIYPKGASGTGTAKVALTIDRSGQLTGLQLVRSSGVSVFDAAALGAVRRAGRFPPAPDDLSKASYSFTLSLSFRP